MQVRVDLTNAIEHEVSAGWLKKIITQAINELKNDQYRVWYDNRWQQVDQTLQAKLEESWAVNIAFIDSEEIRSLNREYHGEDRVTDVLSWGYWDSLSQQNNQTTSIKWPKSGGIEEFDLLGEIAVCYKVIEERAKTKQIEVNDELGKMVIHSLFHLLGLHHA